jgi:16S rRNA (cytosine1402-N4)-methyltransferase
MSSLMIAPDKPMTDARHVPVLVGEVLDLLRPSEARIVLDGTFGAGGHTTRLLERMAPDATLVGMDRDAHNLQEAPEELVADDRLRLVHGSYHEATSHLEKMGIGSVDGILLDLGVSSMQLDDASRGFSIQHDGPLDMRMDASRGVTAADLVADLPEKELADLFFQLGEERRSRRVAARIVRAREEARIETTAELAEIVRRALPGPRRRIHPATRVFQALRIAVNEELAILESGLRSLWDLLAPGGRMVIISFHSLEDRRVKFAFRDLQRSGQGRVLTKKPRTAEESEVRVNRRSRSAKLRGIEKNDPAGGAR